MKHSNLLATIFPLLAIALLPARLSAQQAGSVTGTVIDAATGEPVIRATVQIVGSRFGAITNTNGSYTIRNVPPGAYTVKASYLGYGARCWARTLWGEGLDLARADCDAALRLSPGQPSVLASRGLLGLRQGRFADAWSDYDAAAQSNPGEARYLYGRGVAALRLGRTEEARADIADATALFGGVAAAFAVSRVAAR